MSRKIVIINVRKSSRLVAEASETRTKAVQNHVGNNDKIFPFCHRVLSLHQNSTRFTRNKSEAKVG